MKRMIAVYAGLTLLAGVPFARAADENTGGTETVIVTASALDGVWKIAVPDQISIQGTHAEWGVSRDSFCRIESRQSDDVKIHCLALPMLKDGTVSVDGANVHLAWGWMVARVAFDGVLHSSTQFTGSFAFKFSGIRYDNSAQTTAAKIVLSAGGEDGEVAFLKRLLEESAGGTLIKSIYSDAKDKVPFPKPEDLRALGAIQSVIALGQVPFHNPANNPYHNPDNHQEWLENQKPRDFMSAYDVEFLNGQRICEFHRRSDGRIDRFVCV